MTDFTTSTSNFDKTVQVGIQRRLEEELMGKRVHLADALSGEYLQGTSDTIRFLSYGNFPVVAGTPTPGVAPWLTEGTAPTAIAGTIDYEEMTAYQAGRFTRITDKAKALSPHDLISIYSERIALNAVETIEKYVAETIAGESSLSEVFSGTSNTQTSHVAAGDILVGYNIKQAVAALAAANVPTFGDGYYHAIIHPQVSRLGLMVDDDAGGWMDANKYTDSAPLLRGELGRYAGVRFMESTFANIRADEGTSSIDVYDTLVYGPGAWAFGDVQTLQTFYNSGPEKISDPLNQVIATIGWKAWFGAMVMTKGGGVRFARIQSAGV